MTRRWQPGDVAILNDGRRVFIATDPSDHTLSAIDANGMWYSQHSIAVRDARREAVVDPEQPISDEWVDVFSAYWEACKETCSASPDGPFKAVLAGLFAYIANPPQPKPAEPTGDRATVRDGDGDLWTRYNDAETAPHKPWRRNGFARRWDQLDIPEDGILWHGVGGDS